MVYRHYRPIMSIDCNLLKNKVTQWTTLNSHHIGTVQQLYTFHTQNPQKIISFIFFIL
jgi:hypothetical protein